MCLPITHVTFIFVMTEWKYQFTDMSLRAGLLLSFFFIISIVVYFGAVILYRGKLEVKTQNRGHLER